MEWKFRHHPILHNFRWEQSNHHNQVFNSSLIIGIISKRLQIAIVFSFDYTLRRVSGYWVFGSFLGIDHFPKEEDEKGKSSGGNGTWDLLRARQNGWGEYLPVSQSKCYIFYTTCYTNFSLYSSFYNYKSLTLASRWINRKLLYKMPQQMNPV